MQLLPLRELPQKLRLFAKYHLTHQPARGPVADDELGHALLPFDLAAHYRALEHAPARERNELAVVSYGGVDYPILALAGGAAPPRARARLLVLAGVHGNEHAGLFAAERLLEEAARPGSVYDHIELCVVSPVNPVGAAHGSRYNGDGRDINRDFVRLHTREGRAVMRAYQRFRPHCVVSLHEGPQQGTFVFGNSAVDDELAERLTRAIAESGAPLAAHDYFGRTLHPPGYAGQSRATVALLWLWRQLIGMAATAELAGRDHVAELTVETPWRLDDAEQRIAAQLAAVRAAAEHLARR
ncbi:MAG: DUF2817 domain-containing protein [Myxococcales bacterium]|nr:DUF2817 domain-containing protein [Myxococcales bacterium]